jgi:hypothetical protein
METGIQITTRISIRGGSRRRLVGMKWILMGGSFGVGRRSWGIIGGVIKVCLSYPLFSGVVQSNLPLEYSSAYCGW